MEGRKITDILDGISVIDKNFCCLYNGGVRTAIRQAKDLVSVGAVLIKALKRFYENEKSFTKFDILYSFSAENYLLSKNRISDICLVIKTEKIDFVISFDGETYYENRITYWSI